MLIKMHCIKQYNQNGLMNFSIEASIEIQNFQDGIFCKLAHGSKVQMWSIIKKSNQSECTLNWSDLSKLIYLFPGLAVPYTYRSLEKRHCYSSGVTSMYINSVLIGQNCMFSGYFLHNLNVSHL